MNIKETNKIGDYFGLNWKIIDRHEWHYGMNIELEHGTSAGIANITNDKPIMTGKIALAHIMEYPDYYARLKRMEASAEKKWKKGKPSVFL